MLDDTLRDPSRRPPGRVLIAALVACSSASSGGPAFAQPAVGEAAPQTEVERARALFREGVALSEAGRWAEAAARYREVLGIRRTPIVAYNLARALSETGQLVESMSWLARVEADGRAPSDVREAAVGLREEVAARVGQVTIRIEGHTAGARIRLDDEPVDDRLGVPIPVDPGPHRVAALQDGVEVNFADVDVPERARVRVLLPVPEPLPVPSPGRVASRAPPAPPATVELDAEPGSRGGGSRWWIGVVAGAAALAAVVVAVAVVVGGGSGDVVQGTFEPGEIDVR